MSGLSRFAFVILALAAMLVGQAPAGEDVIFYPAHDVYWSGRVQRQGNSYSKHNSELFVGRTGVNYWQSWIKIDLTDPPLPVGAVIEEAYLYYHVFNLVGTRPENYVTILAHDPVPAPAEQLWQDINEGMIVGNDVNHGSGWVERLLDSNGRLAIGAAAEQGWIAFGLHTFKTPTGLINARGYQGPFKPYLRLRYSVPPVYQPDYAVEAVTAPAGAIKIGSAVIPEVKVRNLGDVDLPFSVRLTVRDAWSDVAYLETVERDGLEPGGEMTISFPELVPEEPEGDWSAVARVFAEGDVNPANDEAVSWFVVVPLPEPSMERYGWEEVRPVPRAPSFRVVRRGSWLAVNEGDGLVYGAKGNKTNEFFVYNPATDRWTDLTGMPWHEHPLWYRRLPQDGARGVSDNDNHIYALQGGKTLGFWRYDIAGDSWVILSDVPEGPARRRIVGGTDMAYVSIDGRGYVYLIKGRTGEFYRYDVAGGEWQELPAAPPGVRERWDRGSWLVSDALGTLYAHKARYTWNSPTPQHELWFFDVRAGVWEQVPRNGLPLVGWHGNRLRNRRSGDGGGAGWFEGTVWSLKGGNSQQYYRYDMGRNQWLEEEPITAMGSTERNRMVKDGGDFVAYPRGRAFYALKGNKTVEFWRYRVPPEGWMPGGGQGARGPLDAGSFTVRPNLVVNGHTTLQYTLPRAGAATVTVIDLAGRTVLSHKLTAARTGSAGLDLRSLVAGVYLVRFEADGFDATRKLVVQK